MIFPTLFCSYRAVNLILYLQSCNMQQKRHRYDRSPLIPSRYVRTRQVTSRGRNIGYYPSRFVQFLVRTCCQGSFRSCQYNNIYFAKGQEHEKGKSPSKLATILRATKQKGQKTEKKTKRLDKPVSKISSDVYGRTVCYA